MQGNFGNILTTSNSKKSLFSVFTGFLVLSIVIGLLFASNARAQVFYPIDSNRQETVSTYPLNVALATEKTDYFLGEAFTLTVTAGQDVYAYIYYMQGEAASLVIPNRFNPDPVFVPAGSSRSFPDATSSYSFTAGPQTGISEMSVLASPVPLDNTVLSAIQSRSDLIQYATNFGGAAGYSFNVMLPTDTGVGVTVNVNPNQDNQQQATQQQATQQQAAAQARAQAEAQARAQAEQQARAQAEQQARAQAEAQARAQAEAQARAQAEAQARALAEQQAQQQAQAQALAQQQAQARAQAEAQARAQAQANTQSSGTIASATPLPTSTSAVAASPRSTIFTGTSNGQEYWNSNIGLRGDSSATLTGYSETYRRSEAQFISSKDINTLYTYFHTQLTTTGWDSNWTQNVSTNGGTVVEISKGDYIRREYQHGGNRLRLELLRLNDNSYKLVAFLYL